MRRTLLTLGLVGLMLLGVVYLFFQSRITFWAGLFGVAIAFAGPFILGKLVEWRSRDDTCRRQADDKESEKLPDAKA